MLPPIKDTAPLRECTLPENYGLQMGKCFYAVQVSFNLAERCLTCERGRIQRMLSLARGDGSLNTKDATYLPFLPSGSVSASRYKDYGIRAQPGTIRGLLYSAILNPSLLLGVFFGQLKSFCS